MCTKCNRFLNLILIKGSALKVCAGSPARQPSLFGCATRSLTVDSHTQLSAPKQLAHLIWGGFRSASCVLPPLVPLRPPGSQMWFFKGVMYIPCSLQCRPACRRHSLYVYWVCWIWALFTLPHLCSASAMYLKILLSSCQVIFERGTHFLPQYLFGCRIFQCVLFENELLLLEFCQYVKHITFSTFDIS